MTPFDAGPRLDVPRGDAAREAVAALRGYAYQLYASAMAWLALPDGEDLHLETAEDYSVVGRSALEGVQVKDTAGSGSLTIRSKGARDAIDSLVRLTQLNPSRRVVLRYLTTSQIGAERSSDDRPAGQPALHYWRRAAGGADVGPLRQVLDRLDLAEATKDFVSARSDEQLRSDLLRRVHWDCGAPPIDALREDLEAGLVELGATTRRLSSQAARAAVPTILERILLTATREAERSLRRADLLAALDEATRVSIPLEHLLANTQQSASKYVEERILSPMDDLPLPTGVAPRTDLITEIETKMLSSGIAIVTGATGLGKSLLARLVAERTGGPWLSADFRDLKPNQSAARLAKLRAELAVRPRARLILDDLNEFDDPAIRDGLARTLAAVRARDAVVIVTSYRPPAPSTANLLAGAADISVSASYLSLEETEELVRQHGGEPRLANFVQEAAAGGHPQLVMATIRQLALANWSRAELSSVLGGVGPGSEREAVRRRLVQQLNSDERSLLLRVTLLRGTFSRELAVRMGEVVPVVPAPGLVLDLLTGPWIEHFRRGRLRVSPLLEGAGEESLSRSERASIHASAAEHMLCENHISVEDAGVLYHHVRQSGEDKLFAGFAGTIVTAHVETWDMLAPFLTELVQSRTTEPVWPENPNTAAMLRLAQLLVSLPNGTSEHVGRVWSALQDEQSRIGKPELFESFALSKILLHENASRLLPDWLELLLRLDQLSLTMPELREMHGIFQENSGSPAHAGGIMLASQMRGLHTPAQVRHLLERLDAVDGSTRARLFSSFGPGRGDIAILINQGWLQSAKTEGFDWLAAGEDYRACTALAENWGDRHLALRCVVAEAICQDEGRADSDAALATIDAATERLGWDLYLVRARAKVLWRRKDHAQALPLLEQVLSEENADTLDLAYVGREAAISSASLGDWTGALRWFERARAAARGSSEIPTVRAMAIGLLADAAHAAHMAGDGRAAVRLMLEAVQEVSQIDPDGNIQEAYCHRVVRHAVLWLNCRIRRVGEDFGLTYTAGTASNPEPLEEIRTHPLGDRDMCFYLLASADRALDEPTGLHVDFRRYLERGPILSLEVSEALEEDRRLLSNPQSADFARRVRRYAAMTTMMTRGEIAVSEDMAINPERGEIPLALIDGDDDAEIVVAGKDFLLSLAISAALRGRFQVLDDCVEAIDGIAELSGLAGLADRIAGRERRLASQDEGTAVTVDTLRHGLADKPDGICWGAAWLLLHVRSSRLGDQLADLVVGWIFGSIGEIVSNRRFALHALTVNLPPIEAILSTEAPSTRSAAALVLHFAPAAGTVLHPQLASELTKIAFQL